jgi:hypothetical protein
MIDLKRYYRLHPKGLCWVEKDSPEKVVVKFKRYDHETMEELSDEVQYANIEELKTEKQNLLNQLEVLDFLLKQIDSI